jgi:hypothetical protein
MNLCTKYCCKSLNKQSSGVQERINPCYIVSYGKNSFGLQTFRVTNGFQERIKFVNRGSTVHALERVFIFGRRFALICARSVGRILQGLVNTETEDGNLLTLMVELMLVIHLGMSPADTSLVLTSVEYGACCIIWRLSSCAIQQDNSDGIKWARVIQTDEMPRKREPILKTEGVGK